jgi:hypothetical protein
MHITSEFFDYSYNRHQLTTLALRIQLDSGCDTPTAMGRALEFLTEANRWMDSRQNEAVDLELRTAQALQLRTNRDAQRPIAKREINDSVRAYQNLVNGGVQNCGAGTPLSFIAAGVELTPAGALDGLRAQQVIVDEHYPQQD